MLVHIIFFSLFCSMKQRSLLLSFISVLLLLPFAAMAQRVQYSKMSPWLRMLSLEANASDANHGSSGHHPFGIARAQSTSRPRVCAFVRVTSDAEKIFSDNDCRSLAQFGDIHIADIPISQLSALSLYPQVKRIEARQGVSCQMDSMAYHLNVLPAYAGESLPQAYTGKGVVVGVQDIGFDLTHPNFYDSTATNYRIRRFWDQISTDTLDSPLYVGRDYQTQDQILSLQHSRDGLDQTHGTHTLGIAAGSGYDSPYRGIAYDSDICLVANASSEDIALIDTADYYKYTYATDALGFKYIFDYAASQGQPCVVSFSEGSQQDFEGYDNLYYAILDSITGPGRILVASAGNTGQLKAYVHKPLGRESAGTFMTSSTDYVAFTAKSASPYVIRTVIYDEESEDNDLQICVATSDILSQPDSMRIDTIVFGERQYTFTYCAYPSGYDASETCIDLLARVQGKFGFTNPVSFEVVGADADVEMFRVSGAMTSGNYADINDAERTHTINSPSSAPAVICVGATGYRTSIVNYQGKTRRYDGGTNGERSSYSSIGPTYDGRLKPDVMAPGSNIISSYSSFYLENHPDANDILSDVAHFDFQGRTYAWNSNAGTSMSTPAVAGAIALWLQAKPDLTPQEAMDVIARTSSHPDADLTYPNNYYGYGQIDVYRGLLDILGLDAIQTLSPSLPRAVRIMPQAGRRVRLAFDTPPTQSFSVAVFSLAGQQVYSTQFSGSNIATNYDLDLSQWPCGVYAVQVTTKQKETTGSTLVRTY